MRLYLMQHGDALSAETDPERALSERGRGDVGRLAQLLSHADFRPARILHSGKARARQSAEMLAARTCPGMAIEAVTGLGPNDPIEPWVALAVGWRDDTLLVGHQPFLGRLASRLVGAASDLIAFQPGSLVCLERPSEAGWRMAWMIRPELLRRAP